MLSDEKIAEVLGFGEFTTEASKVTMTAIARAIEAAVLAEQAKAEPVAYRAKVGGNYVYAPQFSDASAEPLYLHPAPVPEGMVSAEKIHQFLNDREDDSYSCSLLVRDLREFVAAAEKESGK